MNPTWKRVQLYWFSGSGNTLCVARKIQSVLASRRIDARLVPMEHGIPENHDSADAVGIIVPVAEQGTFPLVWNFLENLPDGGGIPLFFVDTMGIYSGGILGPARRIVRKRGYTPIGAREIQMPNTFMRRKERPEADRQFLMKGLEKAEDFVEKLLEGRAHWFDIPLWSDFMSLFSRGPGFERMYREWFPHRISPEKCTSCGLCIRLCPVKNLSTGPDGIPVTADSCIICLRCFEFCPVHAITIGNPKNRRTTSVTSADMLSAISRSR